MLSKTGFTHSDLLRWQIDYAGCSLNVNGTIMRGTYKPESTNKRISSLIKSLRTHVQQYYSMPQMGYLWVREQEKAKHQHYHIILMLDGDKIRHPAKLIKR